jgi:hypothetical protein
MCEHEREMSAICGLPAPHLGLEPYTSSGKIQKQYREDACYVLIQVGACSGLSGVNVGERRRRRSLGLPMKVPDANAKFVHLYLLRTPLSSL